MSTKTLRKRIALVAVSALGFGLISIVPASATAGNAATSTAGGTAQTVQAGATFATTLTLGNLSSNTDTLDVKVTGPAGSTLTVTKVGTVTFNASNTVSPTTAGAISGTALTLSEGSDNANWPGASSGVVALEGSINMPGIYTITAGATTVSTTTITVVAASSLTTTLTASTNNSGFAVVGGSNPVITVARNTNGALADGTILARVDATPDADLTVGQVLGNTAVSGVTAANSSASRQFTFAIATVNTAGTYSFTFWNDANANNALDSGEITTTGSFVVGAASAATDVISATVSRTVGANVDNYRTFTITATVTDADGNPTSSTVYAAESTVAGAATTLNSNNGLTTLGAVGSASTLTRVGTTNQYVGTFTIDAALAATTKTYITVFDTNVTAALGAIKSLTVVAEADLTELTGAKAVAVTDVVGVGSYSAGVRQSLSGARTAALTLDVDKTVTSQTYTFTAKTGEEGKYLRVAVAPAGTTSSAVVAPSYNLVLIGADLTGALTVTATAPAALDSYTLTWTDASGDTAAATVTFKTAAPAWTISPSSSIKAKFGDKVSVTGTLTDQFGRVYASKDIYVVAAASGRNAGRVAAKTDATGSYTFTWTDASASTTVLTDSVTFNYDYAATATATTNSTATSSAFGVTYSATGVVVGSVAVTAPSATNTRPIDYAQTATGLPASGSTVTYTATVKDASGVAVGAGVPVTFAGGAGDLFTTSVNKVTDSLGQASIVVYRQLVGSSAITATAGGIASPAGTLVKWTNDLANATAASAPYTSTAKRNARYIALSADPAAGSVSGGTIRFAAKVTDRFGNPVAGATVTFTENGAGRFLSGQTTSDAVTDVYGVVSVDLSSAAGEVGTASVTATLTTTGGASQLDDIENTITVNASSDGSNTTGSALNVIAGVKAAVKTATATAVIAKDTSTSTADALLALAQALGTKDQASATVDAAAEATDAANAATDAANYAAEAADAATAAAQDASDAVAALSAQVSEAIAGLKKQLVSLTNLVIKIQKKVKA